VTRSKKATEHKIRGFQLLVTPGESSYGLALEETNGRPEHTMLVARADEKHVRAVLPAVMEAVKASGHQRTTLGPQRKTPIVLSEEAGVRLALVLLATGRVSKSRRIDNMLGSVSNMAVEEAYYWYSKCMGADGGRVRKSLRLFLAED
jgi:hypothetical protein